MFCFAKAYLWIDFCSMDQRPQYTGAYVASLPLFAACCDSFVTIAAPDLEERAWCQVERFIAYSISPVKVVTMVHADPKMACPAQSMVKEETCLSCLCECLYMVPLACIAMPFVATVILAYICLCGGATCLRPCCFGLRPMVDNCFGWLEQLLGTGNVLPRSVGLIDPRTCKLSFEADRDKIRALVRIVRSSKTHSFCHVVSRHPIHTIFLTLFLLAFLTVLLLLLLSAFHIVDIYFVYLIGPATMLFGGASMTFIMWWAKISRQLRFIRFWRLPFLRTYVRLRNHYVRPVSELVTEQPNTTTTTTERQTAWQAHDDDAGPTDMESAID